MKKLVFVFLAVLLLVGCSEDAPPAVTTAPTTVPTTAPKADPPEPPAPEKTADIEILSCRFKEQVLPLDHEATVGYFPAEEGKVYIDLTLEVTNTCQEDLDKEDLSAYFIFGDRRYDMQLEVEENAGNFANEDRTVHPGQCRRVHLFYNVDKAALEAEITVSYTLVGQSGTIPVEQEVPPVLEDKQLLQLADTVPWGEAGTLQVMDCLIRPYLSPTGNSDQKYSPGTGNNLFILVVQLDSESELEPALLEAYLMAGQDPDFAQISAETPDHQYLDLLEDALLPQPGEERILHFWVEIPMNMPTEGMAIRLNVDTGSYYCYPIG